MNALYALGFLICCFLFVRTAREIVDELASRPAASHPSPTKTYNSLSSKQSNQPNRQGQASSISRTAPGSYV